MDNNYFMRKALEQAEKALSRKEFPVGCILVYEGRILATGARNGTADDTFNETDHAEMVALRSLSGLPKDIDRDKITLFCTLEPCLMCFGAILLSGIGKIVYAYEDAMGGGTRCDLTQLTPLYKKRQISIVPNLCRSRSLKLFKTFFADPENGYLRGSFLARYTLEA